jgi:hypothetical protein
MVVFAVVTGAKVVVAVKVPALALEVLMYGVIDFMAHRLLQLLSRVQGPRQGVLPFLGFLHILGLLPAGPTSADHALFEPQHLP